MPVYLFQCDDCGTKSREHRGVDTCSQPNLCQCGGAATRRFSGFQVNADPFHLQDCNKFGLGFSATTRLEKVKEGAKRYEERWDKMPVRDNVNLATMSEEQISDKLHNDMNNLTQSDIDTEMYGTH